MNISIPTGSTPTLVLEWDANRKAAILQNNSASDIFIGPSNVAANTAANGGYKLAAGKEIAISNGGGSDPASSAIYAVHAQGGALNLTYLTF
jgi:hypothetical protein